MVTLVAMVFSASALANEQNKVEQIVAQAYQAFYYAGDDGQTKARMLIVDNSGNKQLRQFNIFRKDKLDGGAQDYLVVFEKPTDVKDTVFLVNKKVASEDNRWLYLPGLDLTKRISASDKRTSFVGSHYFYEDISGRNIELDTFEFLEESADTYTIKAIPKDPSSVEFDHYQIIIAKTTKLPMLMQYFKKGKLYRQAEILESEIIDTYPTVLKSKVTDLESGGYTLVQFRKPSYDLGLENLLFTERSLRNPPKTLFTK